MANVYISRSVAIAAEVITNRQMQRGNLIEFCEWPLSWPLSL